MAHLPLANILHYRLRSTLSALGIGIGIAMLLALSGLARGTLGEVSDRWEAVDADLIAYPREWGDNLITMSGLGVRDRLADVLKQRHGRAIARIVPVFLAQVKLGGQDQTLVGVDSDQWATLAGRRAIREGRLFDPDGAFSRWLVSRLAGEEPAEGPATQPSSSLAADDLDAEIAAHGGREIVIDSRLARQGNYRVGQTVLAAGHDWRIVGIVEEGAMARVFVPRRTAQYYFGLGGVDTSTLMFLKLADAGLTDRVGSDLRASRLCEVVPVRQYRAMLERKFGAMYRYIDAVNVVALVIAFLFILVTLYMMVLQRTREIAILRSFGASDAFILRLVLEESLILTGAGALVGVGLAHLAGWAIVRAAPLYTVTITWPWVLIAAGAALAGAVASALFPAWRAIRVDMVEALTLE